MSQSWSLAVLELEAFCLLQPSFPYSKLLYKVRLSRQQKKYVIDFSGRRKQFKKIIMMGISIQR